MHYLFLAAQKFPSSLLFELIVKPTLIESGLFDRIVGYNNSRIPTELVLNLNWIDGLGECSINSN